MVRLPSAGPPALLRAWALDEEPAAASSRLRKRAVKIAFASSRSLSIREPARWPRSGLIPRLSDLPLPLAVGDKPIVQGDDSSRVISRREIDAKLPEPQGTPRGSYWPCGRTERESRSVSSSNGGHRACAGLQH